MQEINVDGEAGRELSEAEREQLAAQARRPVTAARAARLELEAKRHWDLFYKRNGVNFFKDRNWTTREFRELLPVLDAAHGRRTLLEIGCGVGNLIFPLIRDGFNDYFLYACDLSPRAVQLVKENELYDESIVKAFEADMTTDHVFEILPKSSIDVATMIFFMSAIHPDKFTKCISTIYELMVPGGVVLFRDYGIYDMTQMRFKPGHLISENFYMRQDGTRSYFFKREELADLFIKAGFEVTCNDYVERRTINKKEQIDVPRNFLQAKFRKPN